MFSAAPSHSWTPTVFPQFDPLQNPQAADFGRAGYSASSGGVVKWTQQIHSLASPPAGDATSLIQAALDTVGSSGGGTVRLGPGTWQIQPTGLRLTYDNLRLEGAGSAQTTLHVQGTYHYQRTAILLGRSPTYTFVGSQSYPDSWVRQALPGGTEHLAADTLAGSDFLAVTAPELSAGTQVIVTGTPTPEFIAEHGMTGVWTSQMDYPASLRQIVSVEPGGYRLDMPLRYPVRTRDEGRVFPATKLTQNVSLARFTILYERHPATDFESGVGANETAQATAVQAINVLNGLIEEIEIPLLPSRGFEVAYSRHVTLRNCSAYESQNQNSFWNGYQFFVWGCDNLLENCFAQGGRHNYSILMAMSHGNVLHGCRSRTPRFASDFHMHLSHENLVDNFVGEGDRWESIYRPFGSPILHGISGTGNVFWNISSDQSPVVWSAQHALGYVIGTQGTGSVQLGAAYGFAALPVDHAEGVGQGATMEPASLYLYQKRARMGPAQAGEWQMYQ